MARNLVFIGLGSNLGDREKALAAAVDRLPPEIKRLDASRLYETEPWGFADQPPFLNQVIKATTPLYALALLDKLKDIEKAVGRKPNFRYGPRKIDLDILFFNDTILETENLSIPHKEICSRAFVLIPLLEIAPDHIHPVNGKTIRELASIIDQSEVKTFENEK